MALVNIETFRGYLLPLVFLLTGVASLGSGAYYWKQTAAFLAKAIEGTGEVIVMRGEDRHIQFPRQLGEVEETYRPIILFTTREGQQVRYDSIVASYPPRYSVGDKVRILYDPDRPELARINDFSDLWLRPVFLGGVGSILAVLGAASLHTRYKYGRERTRRGYFRDRQ
jgi:hypothetical protein